MICTSIEQSQKLLELGLNPTTADMIYSVLHWDDEPYIQLNVLCDDIIVNPLEDVLCWSLSALLQIIPYGMYRINKIWRASGIKYSVMTIPFKGSFDVDYETCEYTSPLEPVYYLVCWLLENNYISKSLK